MSPTESLPALPIPLRGHSCLSRFSPHCHAPALLHLLPPSRSNLYHHAPLNDSVLNSQIVQGGTNTATLWGLTGPAGDPTGVIFVPQSPNPPQSAATTNPAGTYSWVQVLNTDTMQFLEPPDQAVNPTGNESCSLPNPPLLDNFYPYPSDPDTGTFSDIPSQGLTEFSAFARAFSATATLFWTPNASTACVAAHNLMATGCTVPLPEGSVNWGFGTSVVKNLGINPSANGTTMPWVFDYFQCVANNFWVADFAASSAYPNWIGVSTNGERGTCTPQ